MKRKINYSLIILLLIFSCKEEKKEIVEEGKPTIINIESNDVVISFTDIVNDIEFITLENTKDSFISNVNRIFEFENNLYVFDDTLNKIVVFNSNGDFIRKIGNIGGGPGEFKDLSDVSFNYEKKQIQALAIDKNSIINYDTNGKFVDYYKTDFPMFKFYNLNSKLTGFYIGYYSEDFYNLKIGDNEGKIIYKGFKFPEDNKEDLMKYSFTGHLTTFNQAFLYSDATSSHIYEITPGSSVKLKYKFDFEKNPWPEENKFMHDTFFEKIQRGQLSFLRTQYEENKDALIFCYNHSVTENPKKRTNYQKIGIYDKKSKKVYSHYNFLDDLIYNNITSPKGKTRNDEFFFSTISDSESFIESLKNEKNSTSIGGKKVTFDMFKNDDIQSTIIVKYKIK